MHRLIGLLSCLIVMAGCATPDADRVRDYTQDGIQLYRRGDYAAARESFQAALQLRPGDAGLTYNVGQCYERAGDTNRAEQSYTACLQRDADHVACHHALTMLLVREGRGTDAVRSVEAWLAHSPKLAAAHAEDAWLWHQSGDLPRAQSRLQEALLLDPRDWRALSELGLIYEEQQRPDRALTLYEQSLQGNPDQPDVAKRLDDLRKKGVGRPKPD
jgi:Flp pilus assembly protein TadD